ncbi:hypothetical protein [Bradyrhizobium sp. LTSPM299]|uniref:hypothetical protein n=1 Tax=Bradyrhizobium sp. LTSPM299 TaxID=1619233 RepID=UPI0012E1BCFA|nr:hypothetical protein [Bradyrhizobium sp. LTSPM299]
MSTTTGGGLLAGGTAEIASVAADAAVGFVTRASSRLNAPSTDTQESERHRTESIWIRWPPIENEMPLPAWADGLNSINAASKQKRFIEASSGIGQHASREALTVL